MLLTKKTGTLKKLKSLLNNQDKEIVGVSYQNQFFSRDYTAHSRVIFEDISTKDNFVKLLVTPRVDKRGLMELGNILGWLVNNNLGDVPGVSEGWLGHNKPEEDLPPEKLSVTESIYSADIVLQLKEPEIVYYDFTVAGVKFTLLQIIHEVQETKHAVNILFTTKFSGLYALSLFKDKDLSVRDSRMILELMTKFRIFGKEIVSVRYTTQSKVNYSMFPVRGIIEAYVSEENNGDLSMYGTEGNLYIPNEFFKKAKARVEMNAYGVVPYGFILTFSNEKESLTINLE